MGAAPLPFPTEILGLSREAAATLVARLETRVPTFPPMTKLPRTPDGVAFLLGDTHGDWRSTERVVRAFLDAGPSALLVGLGDYIDRTPDDLDGGSAANALFLLAVAGEFPDRVVLLQGNHETTRRIGVSPADLEAELGRLWGPAGDLYDRILTLFERGPLAAWSESGLYLAHAGFPRHSSTGDWAGEFAPLDDERLAELVWAECGASRLRRGVVEPFSEPELTEFLSRAGLTLFVRGHDPDLNGRPVYSDQCLTLQTTRVYERFGVLFGSVPLDRPRPRAHDVQLHPLT